MYIFKQPHIGGFVSAHQDSTFLHTEPLSTLALWFALEDATINNSCLWVYPGSHKSGVKRRMVRKESGDGTTFIPPDSKPETFPDEVFIPVECPEGTLLVMHGSLVHKSYENLSEHSRHAYTLHVIETENTVWSCDNWLQRKTPVPKFEDLRNIK